MGKRDEINPALSVILVTRNNFDVLRETIRHLVAQTIARRLELVIVAGSRAQLRPDEAALRGLGGWQIVETGTVRSVGHGNAAGIRAARAPVVVLAEDHAFPAPDWAAALLHAHAQPCAAVGPVVHCANPVNQISWADLLIGYGPWLAPAAGGPVEFLPGHNSSYKRSVLLAYGDRLAAMLEAETVLHWDLRAHGHTLLLEPAARVWHVNFSRWEVWVAVQFHAGRVFASMRAANGRWPVVKRLLYSVGAPLIPFIRLARLLPSIRRLRQWPVIPMVLVGLTLDACGQLCGYAAGAGDSGRKLPLYEFNRIGVNQTGRRAWQD